MFCSHNETYVNGSMLVIGKENRYPFDSHPYIIAGWAWGLGLSQGWSQNSIGFVAFWSCFWL